jgi:hypothetical protein
VLVMHVSLCGRCSQYLAVRASSLDSQIFIYTLLLELKLCLLCDGTTRGSDGRMICLHRCFPPLFSLSYPWISHWPFKISELSLYLLRFQLRSLFFWFLIFVLSPFIKFFFVFNFIIQSQFVICFFFNLVLIFLIVFFLSFCWYNFSYQSHSSIKNL